MRLAIGRAREFVFRKYGPWPMVTLAVSIGVFLGSLFFGNWVTDRAAEVWRDIRWLLDLPIGLFGVILFVVLMVLIITAFFDTSPTAATFKEWLGRRKESTPRPPPREERELVQDLRTVWNRYGQIATYHLKDLFGSVTEELERKQYLAELLKSKVDELEKAGEAMQGIVGNELTRIAEAREAFNRLYKAYLCACTWLGKIEAAGDVGLALEPYGKRLGYWRVAHRTFRDKLEDLVQIPAHSGTLSIYLHALANQALVRFLKAAERPEPTQGDEPPKPEEPGT